MKNLLTFLLMNLVDHPDDVKVSEEQSEFSTEYIIQVNPEDIGKVIGKQGKIIRSIRNLAKVRAMKEKRKIFVRLAEE